MGRDDFVDFFGILTRYKKDHPDKIVPTNLKGLEAFEDACREEGRNELADWLENWRLNLEYHIAREFSE